MWTLIFVVAIIVFWYIILPVWANYQTIRWNERSRGQHRYLYRTRPTPEPECQVWMKDCYCGRCRAPEDVCEPKPPEQGPFR